MDTNRRPIAHEEYEHLNEESGESHALLTDKRPLSTMGPSSEKRFDLDEEATLYSEQIAHKKQLKDRWIPILYSSGAFALGVLLTLGIQALTTKSQSKLQSEALFDQYALADDQKAYPTSSAFHFPPASPTNGQFASYFPSNVGFAGPTPTGLEAGLIQTAPAYPVHTGAPALVGPQSLGGAKGSGDFDVFKHWGNLSPWYSVPSSAFGLPDASPEAPAQCVVTGLHFLHRHGARYPTSSKEGPERFRDRINQMAQEGKKWKASGDLAFLNDWTYVLGNELLTPFGRQQLYDLGINLRIKYGYLLNNFTYGLPVFRTESQDRMVQSAMNFALGFFGWPLEGKYFQSITYETPGINNTLAPYHSCPNDGAKGSRGGWYVNKWVNIYLVDAAERLQTMIDGMEMTPADAYNFQQICAYETVALGYSRFCELFTQREWEGFEYAMDLQFWYNNGPGSPVSRAQGLGYIQEMVARLTHTPIHQHNSTTNATLDDNPITFPLQQSLYVDATHEVVVLNILTVLNLTNLAATGPLPYDHIPANRSFVASQLAPFATNVQFQLLSCSDKPDTQIRIVINDGVTTLTGIDSCPEDKDGLCPLSNFVEGQQQTIRETDFNWDCYGDWRVEDGNIWNTTTGEAPSRNLVNIAGSGVTAPS